MTATELRWILLFVGVIILVVIYLTGRQAQVRRRSREEADAAGETSDVCLDTRSEHDDIAPEPEPFDELQEMLREEVKARAAHTPTPAPEPERKFKAEPKRIKPRPAERPQATGDKIISLYVVARRPSVFRGEAILRAAEQLNLEYGDMQIFNRVIERSGRRYILFSVANAVQPGTFDDESLNRFTTPGLALFMQLPGPLEGLKAFNAMLDCAQRLKVELNGELLDETRSVLSNQTIDHMREEIQLYSLRTARVRRIDHAP
jgi:cell division protein ZipA